MWASRERQHMRYACWGEGLDQTICILLHGRGRNAPIRIGRSPISLLGTNSSVVCCDPSCRVFVLGEFPEVVAEKPRCRLSGAYHVINIGCHATGCGLNFDEARCAKRRAARKFSRSHDFCGILPSMRRPRRKAGAARQRTCGRRRQRGSRGRAALRVQLSASSAAHFDRRRTNVPIENAISNSTRTNDVISEDACCHAARCAFASSECRGVL